MGRGTLYWGLMIAIFISGCWQFSVMQSIHYSFFSTNIILFILLALVGWEVYGPALKKD